MSDRTRCLVVVLDEDYRTDDAQSIVDAIKMVRGVVSVRAHVSDITQHVAIETARSELRRKLHEVLR